MKKEKLKMLTIGTCSYNTPVITETMLKSLVDVSGRHFIDQNKLLIVDNSTDGRTASNLNRYNIPYIKNPGGRHEEGAQILLDNCSTRYLLLVDTDVLFLKNPSGVLDLIQNNNLLGKVTGSRGGKILKDRVDPWFCLIDIDFVKKHNIPFSAEGREEWNQDAMEYDVGTSFYEDIVNAGGSIKDIDLEKEYFEHIEGMSWQYRAGSPVLRDRHKHMLNYYLTQIAPRYMHISLGK